MQYYIDANLLKDILCRVLCLKMAGKGFKLVTPPWIKAGTYKGALDLRIQRKTHDNLK